MNFGDPQNLVLQCPPGAPRPLCHCLNVSEGEVKDAIADGELQTVRGVSQACGAGSGCTACHRHIKRFLNERALHRRMQSLGEVVSEEQLGEMASACGS